MCQRVQTPYEVVKTLYYSTFIPLRVEGRDVAILISEDEKTLYNIKPSPTRLKQPKETTDDDDRTSKRVQTCK